MTEAASTGATDPLGPKAGELAPRAAEILRAGLESSRPNAHLLPVEEARRNFDADFEAVGPGEDVHEVKDLSVPVGEAEIPARLYRPSPGRLPAIVYFHGGGFLLGSIDSHEVVTRALANASGAAVLSVGYRRGPEHRFPTAHEDAYAAAAWIHAHANDLDLESRGLAVAGDSAGANLAIGVARLARERGGPALTMMVLAYPVTTTNLDVGFDDDYEGYMLYRDELQWHQDNYLPSPDVRHDPLVSPLEAGDLAGLPPALVITAQCDPLHRQGELFVQAVEEAGGPVEHLHYDGMIHGFVQTPSEFEDGADALRRAGEALARSFRSEAAEP